MRAWDCQSRAPFRHRRYFQVGTLIETQATSYMYRIPTFHIRQPAHVSVEVPDMRISKENHLVSEAEMQHEQSLHSQVSLFSLQQSHAIQYVAKRVIWQDYTFIAHGVRVKIHIMQSAPDESNEVELYTARGLQSHTRWSNDI
jgi:hypothetical protein